MVVEMSYKGIHTTQDYSRGHYCCGPGCSDGLFKFHLLISLQNFLLFFGEKFPFQARVNQSIM